MRRLSMTLLAMFIAAALFRLTSPVTVTVDVWIETPFDIAAHDIGGRSSGFGQPTMASMAIASDGGRVRTQQVGPGHIRLRTRASDAEAGYHAINAMVDDMAKAGANERRRFGRHGAGIAADLAAVFAVLSALLLASGTLADALRTGSAFRARAASRK